MSPAAPGSTPRGDPEALDLAAFIRDVPDFPRPGIVFKDLTPLLGAPRALSLAVRRLADRIEPPDAVVAIESRGFVFGAGVALRWGVPFVPARKFGKLPGPTVRESYALEYGDDSLEIHADAIARGARVAIVDDVLATGGTARATGRLVERLGGEVAAVLVVVELIGLGGRETLAAYPVEALLQLEAA